jgi:putative addiction module component (TIGR02574 family)
MIPTIKSLGLENLPIEHKLAIVEELWDNIAADAAALPIPQSHLEELERRLATTDGDPCQPWEEAIREIESDL